MVSEVVGRWDRWGIVFEERVAPSATISSNTLCRVHGHMSRLIFDDDVCNKYHNETCSLVLDIYIVMNWSHKYHNGRCSLVLDIDIVMNWI